MYRLSEELAHEILKKIKVPEIESTGENAFKPKNFNSVGIIDPTVAIGTDYYFSIECPVPIVYPDFPYVPVGVYGYFLYRKEELLRPMESWMITRVLVDPNCKDYEEQLDVTDCAIILPSNVDKLVAPTITNMSQLISKEPLIIDCLSLNTK